MDGLISRAYAAATPLCQLDEVVTNVFDRMWPLIGIALFGMFTYGGVLWFMSAGDSQKVSRSTSTILWAFIGMVILALMMVIMGTMEDLLGLTPGSLRGFNIDCT
ncbi:MAG: hypothetical protein PHG63_03320 [Candidatus Dojkabacteria bacterium]|nr:hypothetical protein [Candidatus Dojkabacteria bacterium]